MAPRPGLIGILTILAFGSLQPAAAKPEYTRRTNKPCTFCHPGPGWVLNDAGKYYRDHNYSLKGYEPKPAPKSSH